MVNFKQATLWGGHGLRLIFSNLESKIASNLCNDYEKRKKKKKKKE
jgi:hypothetical protein